MPLFPPGQIVSTVAARAACERFNTEPMELVRRHIGGDWGVLSESDVRANQDAVTYGDRILSKYLVGTVWMYVITEADRSSTCILLTHEY